MASNPIRQDKKVNHKSAQSLCGKYDGQQQDLRRAHRIIGPNKDFDHSQIHLAAWRPLTDFCARKRACIVLYELGWDMWGRKRQPEKAVSEEQAGSPLQRAVHQARIEAAERTSVVVDLRDAESARLELLNEALDPLFAAVPADVELFDRSLSRGDTPRLWIDPVAHIAMGRDKRTYRFLYDTRIGRRMLAESHEIPDIVKAVTDYVARRLIERERALAEDFGVCGADRQGRSSPPDASAPASRPNRIRARLCRLPARTRPGRRYPGDLGLTQRLPPDLADTAVGGVLPNDHLAAKPSIRVSNPEQVIARGIFVTVRRLRRGRGCAGRRYWLLRTVEPHQRMVVIVPMNDQLGASLRQHVAKLCGV